MPRPSARSPEYRRNIAAAALAELEVGRIPLKLREGFDFLNQAPPGMGDVILLAAFAEDQETLDTWLLACPDGKSALADAAASANAVKDLYDRCDLGRLGLLGDTELGGVSLGLLVGTHAVWAHLVEHDSETDIEKRFLRMILGRG